VTTHGRSKEYAFDYRYFPEPDLSPIEPASEWIEKLRAELPELPAAKRERLAARYGALTADQAGRLAVSPVLAGFFEEAVALGTGPAYAANALTQDVAALVNELGTPLDEG
jgi:aspartyl-tRNA(Asn)/glutamyl-tRNA(Gln) amidotransferase subunit B